MEAGSSSKVDRSSTVREALLWEAEGNGTARCGLCERRCLIPEGKRGGCGMRANVDGRLLTLAYGNLAAAESRPIEIKPFYHFYPGSSAYTYCTWSCNLTCPWCQNYQLSRRIPDLTPRTFVSPEKVVQAALSSSDDGLCVSFTEPTLLFEHCLDAFPLAKKNGLYTCFVSNGYMTSDALKMLAEAGLDGIKIDIKGMPHVYERFCGGIDASVVWRNAKVARDLGLHVEIVNLVITDVNDDQKSLNWVIEQHLRCAGPETPLHFTRYHPAHKLKNPATSVRTVEKACEMARSAGVLFPYAGNVPMSHKFSSTYCPECGKEVIRRSNWSVVWNLIESGACPHCGTPISIVK
jgi:pyruvate formate lyase activating enzyme